MPVQNVLKQDNIKNMSGALASTPAAIPMLILQLSQRRSAAA